MSGHALSRRGLLLGSAVALPFAGLAYGADLTGPLTPLHRRRLAFERRQEAARTELNGTPAPQGTNGDEDRYPDRRASFTKTLPHDELGEVERAAYRRWL